MRKTLALCGAVLLAMPALTLATDYPLEFKTLDAQHALALPSGSITYAMIQPAKPAGILKAPPAVSQHPLYGMIESGTNQLFFRLDESKGTGKGYDRLVVDINCNGDLTDDPVAGVATPPKGAGTNDDQADNETVFGPIQAPNNFMIGTNRPVFFAQVYVFGGVTGLLTSVVGSTVGEISVRPGWYLEAAVNADGKQHKVALVDADCNFHVGDAERAVIYPGVNGAANTWSFQGGDRFMVDWEASKNTGSSLFNDQSCSFGPILYVGAKPYKAALAPDFSSLSLDAWPEPLAGLELAHAEQIASLELAWEKTPGEWILIKPKLDNGKAKVPPGNYRLYSTYLKGKIAPGDHLTVTADAATTAFLQGKTPPGNYLVMTGTRRVAADSVKAVAGMTTPLKCGAPLQLSLTTTFDPGAAASGFFSKLANAILGSSGPSLHIQATLLGAGGETYSVPYLMDEKGGLRTPPGPTFTVLNAERKKVDSGSLEYG